MTFLDWMNMNMIVDIACVVFFVAVTWKIRSIQKDLLITKETLKLSIKNPQQARRRLKKGPS